MACKDPLQEGDFVTFYWGCAYHVQWDHLYQGVLVALPQGRGVVRVVTLTPEGSCQGIVLLEEVREELSDWQRNNAVEAFEGQAP